MIVAIQLRRIRKKKFINRIDVLVNTDDFSRKGISNDWDKLVFRYSNVFKNMVPPAIDVMCTKRYLSRQDPIQAGRKLPHIWLFQIIIGAVIFTKDSGFVPLLVP